VACRTDLWIEKDTLLLRKFSSERETSRSEELRTSVRINEPIESVLFAAELKDLPA
jgi:hypothetical protein